MANHPLRGYLVTYTVWVAAHDLEGAEQAVVLAGLDPNGGSIEPCGIASERCYDPLCPENEETP